MPDRWPEPPWGQRLHPSLRAGIHQRWIDHLRSRLPQGVPAADDTPGWPATFGDRAPDGSPPAHSADNLGDCLQCGGCQFYLTLEGPLGADWGVCTNQQSEYDGRAVFEHWTCSQFDPGEQV